MKRYNLETGCMGALYPSTDNIYSVIDNVEAMFPWILKDFNRHRKHWRVHIICKGSSGLMRATFLAERFYKENIDVSISFDNRGAHSVAHDEHAGSWMFDDSYYQLIVDDFCCSCRTMRKIASYINESCEDPVTINAIVVNSGARMIEEHIFDILNEKPNLKIKKIVNVQ